MLTLPLKNIISKTAKTTLWTTILRSLTREYSKIQRNDNKNLQEAAMDSELLLLLDENDKVTGLCTKRKGHQVGKDGNLPLHRAFSVYLFNNNGDLLLQKRSPQKITYPNMYTNSCCSHPLKNFPGEEEETDGLGVKGAAQRRLNFELGIPKDKLPLENFSYLTRIQYEDKGDGKWGEHELFYVLFLRGDLPIKPNPDEISEVIFIPREKLDEIVTNLGTLTPWFRLIFERRLKIWWDNLDSLDRVKDHENIFRFG